MQISIALLRNERFFTICNIQKTLYNSNTNPFELWRVQIIESNYRGNLIDGTEKSVRVIEVSSYGGSIV